MDNSLGLLQNGSDFPIEALIIVGLNTSTFGVHTPTTVFNMISTAAQ